MIDSDEDHAPPYFITVDDKRDLIVVTVALVLAFVWACCLIRGDWKADDRLLASATSGIILNLVDSGLGTSQNGVPLSQLERLGKHGIASQILYICTLFLSKCSVLFLYLRLSPGASFVWAIMAIILIIVSCNPAQFYTEPGKCTNRSPKWQAVSSIDIVTKALIFGISKLIVVFAFSARLPVIAVTTVRFHFLHLRFLGTSSLFEYIIASQWQMGYAIMSSTITGMGPFLRPFDKEYTTSHHKRSDFGHSFERSHAFNQSCEAEAPGQLQRNSWQWEGYLMQPISSQGSGTSLPDTNHSNVHCNLPVAHKCTTSTPTKPDSHQLSRTSQAHIMLTADANFRPVDNVSRNDTEIWVGDRTASFGTEDAMPTCPRDDRGSAINNRTQFKIEVDRASRVV
ncbi:hypothetical protein GQ44DRAFT_743608 [Phaeosphaeriaceae sp. PMI808]|nr:hypothetical protein GQ44DRAFT_743608 [Phaeosphaeriaceae sp. PMI808]